MDTTAVAVSCSWEAGYHINNNVKVLPLHVIVMCSHSLADVHAE